MDGLGVGVGGCIERGLWGDKKERGKDEKA